MTEPKHAIDSKTTTASEKPTYTSDLDHDGKPDVIPPIVRTITYYTGSILNAVVLALLIVALACGWSVQQLAILTAICAGYDIWANSVGAAYHPVTPGGASKALKDAQKDS